MRGLAVIPGLLWVACLPSGPGLPDAGPVIVASPEERLLDAPAADQVAAFEDGGFTASSVLEAALDRVARQDKAPQGTNAVLAIDPRVRPQAAAVDTGRGRGAPLQGALILVKDNIDVEAMATTAGSLAMVNNLAPTDAFIVKRLRGANAIILGKANLSEWANFRSTRSTSGWSSVGGQTRNGWSTGYNPCGSSSGSAAAVAARLVPIALGSETDGSITCPAALNGVVGLKPTLGLVSRGGSIPAAPSFDVLGPLTRTVTDAALVLSVIAGVDPGDAATAAIPAGLSFDFVRPLASASLSGKRLGLIVGTYDERALTLLEKTRQQLTAAGATVVDVTLALPPWAKERATQLRELKDSMDRYLAARTSPGQPASLTELIAWNDAHRDQVMPYFGQESFVEANTTAPNAAVGSATYASTREEAITSARDILGGAIDRLQLDALIGPTEGPLWVTNYRTGDPAGGYSQASLPAIAGWPHLTVPMATDGNAPVGLSFIGRAWEDGKLLMLGAAYERLRSARTP